jgi:hypothetical protein
MLGQVPARVLNDDFVHACGILHKDEPMAKQLGIGNKDFSDEELHRHAIENLNQADALLIGRVTYKMMEAAFRPQARAGARPDWMKPFARTIDAAKQYVV